MGKEFRPGVMGVFLNDSGHLLGLERSDTAGQWQLPQGGIEHHESPPKAIMREMSEELGLDTEDMTILKRSPIVTCYRFPPDLPTRITRKYCGQTHIWYLLRTKRNPLLEKSDGEFVAFRWMPVQQVVDGVIPWKRSAYLFGLRSLELL